ncbi:hypothetical protein AMATHDRAFT_3092 [Amanita thiersii Skay4041]|uniref:Cytochrome c oxidase subunit 8, mitochondrial n=1 Tax=Amanita thiersii Skay4041 TaxID=703135 RepID=A0A2A9NUI5_9AGAR|nr:hypothetical protein AMATHDRAFT_3092 [Amanita thiersii Skay4041]
MLSAATRTLILRQRPRAFHSSAVARSDHGHYHHLPFNFPGEKKGVFAIKLFAFMASGFSIPLIAAGYQLKKSGGAS